MTRRRLHNKKNLMEELKKVKRIINRRRKGTGRDIPGSGCHTGKTPFAQAKTFKEITDITGIILTKLDGTAKGGIVFAIGRNWGSCKICWYRGRN